MAAKFDHIENQCTGLLSELSSLMSVYTREKAEEQQECAKSRCLVVDGLKGSELPRTMIEKMGVAFDTNLLGYEQWLSGYGQLWLGCDIANMPAQLCPGLCGRCWAPNPTILTEISSKILGWAWSHGWPASQLVCQANFKDIQCQLFIVLGASAGGAGYIFTFDSLTSRPAISSRDQQRKH
jgi:hypothetical protein